MATNLASPTPGSTLHVKGELFARENLTIEGTLEGAVTLDGFELTAGARARVNAAVTAKAVTVLGELKGHITADAVDVLKGATVEASVMARTFTLDDGAIFNGQVNTERARAAGDVARHRLTGRRE